MRVSDERGFGLILLITLIAIASIFISGTTIFVTNAARETQLKTDRAKAASLAQAGLLQALHNWRVSNASEASRTYSELNATVTGAQGYQTGTQADFAYFTFDSPANAFWSGSNTLAGWTIRNIHSASATPLSNLTVKQAIVSWTPQGNASRRLSRIRLNGTPVYNASAPNGALIPLTGSAAARTLAPGASWTGNNTDLRWSGALPSPVRVTVQWIFQDDSSTVRSRSHSVVYWDGAQANAATATAARPSRHTFSIVATGRVSETTKLPRVLSTVKATVSGNAAGGFMEIIDWDGVDQNLFS
ncbi:MAG TPA: hypothetical protein VL404_04370 [Candidatus Eisenbacteria bacterium]|nr:hypothetical protein [Candidatus Eisenbacteria bacterium]